MLNASLLLYYNALVNLHWRYCMLCPSILYPSIFVCHNLCWIIISACYVSVLLCSAVPIFLYYRLSSCPLHSRALKYRHMQLHLFDRCPYNQPDRADGIHLRSTKDNHTHTLIEHTAKHLPCWICSMRRYLESLSYHRATLHASMQYCLDWSLVLVHHTFPFSMWRELTTCLNSHNWKRLITLICKSCLDWLLRNMCTGCTER